MALVELMAVRIGDAFIRCGRAIHSRWAVVPDVPREPSRADRWRSHVQAFALWSGQLSFSQRKTIAAGIVTRKGFDVYMAVLKQMGVVVVWPRSGAAWAAGWDHRKFAALVRRGLVQVPCPADRDPPAILRTRAAHTQCAQLITKRAQSAQVSTVFASDHGRALRPGQLVTRR